MGEGIKKVKRWELAPIKTGCGELYGLWFLAERQRARSSMESKRTTMKTEARSLAQVGSKIKASISTTVLPFWVMGIVAILLGGGEERAIDFPPTTYACKI